jgi:hypothetical protein
LYKSTNNYWLYQTGQVDNIFINANGVSRSVLISGISTDTYYGAVTYDKDIDSPRMVGYKDGAFVSQNADATGNVLSTDTYLDFGRYYGNESLFPWSGLISETRISSTARGAGWINATNKTLRDLLVTAGNITSTPSMGAYPLGADTVKISDTTGILGWAYPTASDTFLLSGDPSEYFLASVLGASGFALSDFPEESVISDVSCSDGFLLSALTNQLYKLYPTITDSVVLSDMARAYLKAYRIIQTISARSRTNPSNWRPIVDEGNNRNLK